MDFIDSSMDSLNSGLPQRIESSIASQKTSPHGTELIWYFGT